MFMANSALAHFNNSRRRVNLCAQEGGGACCHYVGMMPHWRAKGGQKKKFKFIGNGAATGHTHNTNTHILYTSVAQNQISVSWREGK